ncbi:MAG: hypothetical protein KF886_12525 [Candidatus Hydrogenedentes bacterium]|nr:hypothetical protein [Candidatus Hydrogenedentota bacterium]
MTNEKSWPAASACAQGEEGGITLLEAYSVLAKKSGANATLEIPFPGHPSGSDAEGRFWGVRIQKAG